MSVYYVLQYLPDPAMGDERINIGIAVTGNFPESKAHFAFTQDFDRINVFQRGDVSVFIKSCMQQFRDEINTKACLDNVAAHWHNSVIVVPGRGSIESRAELMEDLRRRVLRGMGDSQP